MIKQNTMMANHRSGTEKMISHWSTMGDDDQSDN